MFRAQGIELRWQMKREMLSPAYITQLEDIPVVNAR